MSEIHYIERVPRRSDFCGCPPCPMCYDPVITDDNQAPTFEEKMRAIYGEGPMPQNEQEYEWAHAAAHQCRKELNETRPEGGFFEAEDRARTTQMQIDDMLRRAKRAAEVPKPLNRVNLDDMPMVETQQVKEAAVPAAISEVYNEVYSRYMVSQLEQVSVEKAMRSVYLPQIENDPQMAGGIPSKRSGY